MIWPLVTVGVINQTLNYWQWPRFQQWAFNVHTIHTVFNKLRTQILHTICRFLQLYFPTGGRELKRATRKHFCFHFSHKNICTFSFDSKLFQFQWNKATEMTPAYPTSPTNLAMVPLMSDYPMIDNYCGQKLKSGFSVQAWCGA